MMSKAIILAVCVSVVVYFDVALAANYLAQISDDVRATEARNVRVQVKYHYELANDYQDRMLEAEDKDDVEKYEKYLSKMRIEDEKWLALEAKYNAMRDQIELRIRESRGQMHIQGFEMSTNKGKVASIFDHVFGKVQE